MNLSDRAALLTAAAIGAALWIGVTLVSGRREAWDAALYWTLAYPLGLAAAVLLGALAPRRPWRWGLTLMLTQAVVLATMAASFSLLPLGLVIFGGLSVPLMGAGMAGAWLRRRRA